MKEHLEKVGCIFIGVATVIAVIFIISLIIKGGVWIAAASLPVFIYISFILFILNLIVFFPLTFIKKTRKFGGSSMFLSSYIIGITVWLWCLVLTFKLCGWLGVIIGVILLGIGVVPIGILSALFTAHFSTFFLIIFFIIIAWLIRMFGASVLGHCVDKYTVDATSSDNDDVIDVEFKDED